MSSPDIAQQETSKWATFWLAGEIFSVRVEDVQEVLMMQTLTPVPLAADYIVGLLNLRGQIMPAIDLRRRLHFAPRQEGNAGSLLVLKTREGLTSVLVDDIGDVLELPQNGWRPPPDTLASKHRGFVRAICPIDQHVVLALRVEELSNEDASTRRQEK